MGADAKAAIRQAALDLGFDAVGFAPPALAAEARRNLAAFLARGYHGDMGWLAARADERGAPEALWPEVKSVVVLALNYAPEDDALAGLATPGRGNISVYARGRDYHAVMKSRLKTLARQIEAEAPGPLKLFVDTAPVMEKPLATNAGIGWQGKHTNLVSRAYGSWLFLGEIYLSIALEPDAPETDHCGACHACLDACPTQAFPAPYQLDARRCISYLTIEHKGHIPEELRPAIGNRLYGCDDCLAVCPWNKFAQTARETRFWAHAEAPTLAELAVLDDAGFRARFAGSPLKRTGRDRFIRNVMIAIGNSGDQSLASHAINRLDDVSPLVRAMAVWALRRLIAPAALARLGTAHAAAESDPDVRAEWAKALARPVEAGRDSIGI
ncbi:MAG TPA: tRNA epoxyqueuosine(34) reductase QueG [Stellaceae bacterium]|jgi:epoxyqueuosine reductase|nr:tRNA epoxyqueuosine(34) reductase QueG [Stellaceae bacterium]